MNKKFLLLVVLILAVIVGFIALRKVRHSGNSTAVQTNTVQKSSVSAGDMVKKSVEASRTASAVTNKPKINVGLTAARPRWLAATEASIAKTGVEVAASAKKIDAVEKKLRRDNEDIASKYTAMKSSYSKYRISVAATDLYKAALLKAQQCTLKIDKITAEQAAAGSEDGIKAQELKKKLAAGYDELAAASTQVTAVEDQIRAENPSVAQAYAEMVKSRKIYRASLKSDEGYNNAKLEAEKLLQSYQNLIKRRNKLKKEIGNE